ncbi:hypothetical protein M422DRAFT_242743 [Sphaerobolus stellatus SS14]|nr:hypothetical protein M422DRAFT_242743 [Sphaerobolus stellatus SS14]
MPKATLDRFSRVRKPSQKKAIRESNARGTNPLFNTAQFGQHILNSSSIVQRIMDAANIKATDHVLEVEPGTGNLTVHILEKAKQIIAVKMDPRIAAELVKRVQGT